MALGSYSKCAMFTCASIVIARSKIFLGWTENDCIGEMTIFARSANMYCRLVGNTCSSTVKSQLVIIPTNIVLCPTFQRYLSGYSYDGGF